MTLPQIIMLNHASYVNHERMEERVKQTDKKKKSANEEPQWKGKPISELNSEEFSQYWAGGGSPIEE